MASVAWRMPDLVAATDVGSLQIRQTAPLAASHGRKPFRTAERMPLRLIETMRNKDLTPNN